MRDRLTSILAVAFAVFLMWRAVQLVVFVITGNAPGWRAALIGGSAVVAAIAIAAITAFLVVVYRIVVKMERDHYGRAETLPAMVVPAVTRLDGTADEETRRVTEDFDPEQAVRDMDELGYQRLGSYHVAGDTYQTSRAAFLSPDATSVVSISPAFVTARSFFGHRTLTTATGTAYDYGIADIAMVSCLSSRPVPLAHAESLAVARSTGWQPDALDSAVVLDLICMSEGDESARVRRGELRRAYVRALFRPRINSAERLAKVIARWGPAP